MYVPYVKRRKIDTNYWCISWRIGEKSKIKAFSGNDLLSEELKDSV